MYHYPSLLTWNTSFSDHQLHLHFATEFGAHHWFPFHLVSPTLTRSSQLLPDGAGTLLKTRACGGRPPPSGAAALEEWERRVTRHLSSTSWIKRCSISLVSKSQIAMKAKGDAWIAIWLFVYLRSAVFLFTLKLMSWFVSITTHYSHANYSERGTHFYNYFFEVPGLCILYRTKINK